MTTEKAIEMIDEYLLEPNSIAKDWIECLRLCKQALLDKEALINGQESLMKCISKKKETIAELEAEVERWKNAYKQCAWERDIFSEEHKFCNLLGNTLVFSKNLKDYNDMRKGLKSKAIKEFAEWLKEKAYEIYGAYEVVDVSDIDNLVEIMTPRADTSVSLVDGHIEE